jgi:hypothetical protein
MYKKTSFLRAESEDREHDDLLLMQNGQSETEAEAWRRILHSSMCSHDIYDLCKHSIWLSARNFKQLLLRITTI